MTSGKPIMTHLPTHAESLTVSLWMDWQNQNGYSVAIRIDEAGENIKELKYEK